MARKFIGNHSFKGHGSLSNPATRFDVRTVESVIDDWYQDEIEESLSETVLPDHARRVITTNDSPDVGFDRSINPYRGCSHACVYCFARPTHGYLGLSPGLDFETQLFYKADAANLLQAELSRPAYACKPIALGVNTDGYQPLERRLGITRSILEVFVRYRHPVTIITKSALVLRDLDLLVDLATDRLVSVLLSVTSFDPELKRILEPRAASATARLRVIEELASAGVPVGVMVAPVIPAITDHEMEAILQAARTAGATAAGYVLLRLPHEVSPIFREWLQNHYPERAAHVMSLVRQSRGGKDYDSTFGARMRGTGPYADLLRARFELAKRRLGFKAAHERHDLNTQAFRRPRPERTATGPQMTFGF